MFGIKKGNEYRIDQENKRFIPNKPLKPFRPFKPVKSGF